MKEQDPGLKQLDLNESNLIPQGPQGFGQILESYRKREGFSRRKLAGFLQVDETTLAKIEAGTRKPPRDQVFYELLSKVPNFSEEDVRLILASGRAPQWLDSKGQAIARARTVISPGPGMVIPIYADEKAYDPSDIILIEKEIELVVKEYLARKNQRAARLDSFFESDNSPA